MYRFRNVEYLLGEKYQELYRQEIFFASSESLNDPLEGFKEIVWKGDSIVWKNFFKHYLVCLMQFMVYTTIGIETNEEKIDIYLTEEDLPSEKHKIIFNDIKRNFFNKEIIITLLEKISKLEKKIYEKELLYFITFIFDEALDSISYGYRINNLNFYKFQKDLDSQEKDKLTLINLFDLLDNHSDVDFKELIGLLSSHIEQVLLMVDDKNKSIVKYCNYYLNKVKTLIHVKWNTACFMSDYRNSSVWGHYGNNHTGVCLIFKTIEIDGSETLKLISPKIEKEEKEYQRIMKFEKIEYKNEPFEVDFFSSLGGFPLPTLERQWYSNENGETSKSYKKMDNIDKWRKEYWDIFMKSITRKTQDWEYEKESRLIMYSVFNDELKVKKLRYDFNDLEGIIFGIKTSNEHKREIIKIIKEKCISHDRKDFKFYQAEFSKATGKIEKKELNLISM